jgi:1-acyl-sn-glycerol-3-phosphate acyltransferase
MTRRIIRSLIGLFFRLLTHTEVFGLENVPASGGAILASNHLNILDPPLIYLSLNRTDSTAWVAKKHQRNPFFRWLVNAIGGIWLNRQDADAHAFRAACEYLKAGHILGISPEGTRSKTGVLMPAKTGVAFLADKAGVPILPAAITGTYQSFRQLYHFHRPRITVRFGKPFRLPPIERQNRNQALQCNTDEIMCQIAAMLPLSYRGVYAEHSRLMELLEGGREMRTSGFLMGRIEN